MSGDGQKAARGKQRLARQQQNEAAVSAEFAEQKIFSAERKPLDSFESFGARHQDDQQKGNRDGRARDARARRKGLEGKREKGKGKRERENLSWEIMAKGKGRGN
jgi:hypothetical protein